MSYSIDPNKCMGCHTCQGMCPMGAISISPEGKCQIDTSKCIHCGTCASVCPIGAINPA